LFILKTVHLSSDSYNFYTQPNIARKFAQYVAWSLLCKRCKFGANSKEIEFFLRVYFLARPVY